MPQILRRAQHCRFGQDNATLFDYMGDKLGTDVFIPSVQPNLKQHRAHSQQVIGIHVSMQLEMLQFMLKDQSLMSGHRDGIQLTGNVREFSQSAPSYDLLVKGGGQGLGRGVAAKAVHFMQIAVRRDGSVVVGFFGEKTDDFSNVGTRLADQHIDIVLHTHTSLHEYCENTQKRWKTSR